MSQSIVPGMDKMLFPVVLTKKSTDFSKFLTVSTMKTPQNVECNPSPALAVSLVVE
jgi:hypothetical protein